MFKWNYEILWNYVFFHFQWIRTVCVHFIRCLISTDIAKNGSQNIIFSCVHFATNSISHEWECKHICIELMEIWVQHCDIAVRTVQIREMWKELKWKVHLLHSCEDLCGTMEITSSIRKPLWIIPTERTFWKNTKFFEFESYFDKSSHTFPFAHLSYELHKARQIDIEQRVQISNCLYRSSIEILLTIEISVQSQIDGDTKAKFLINLFIH